jgi:hypothetical protein
MDLNRKARLPDSELGLDRCFEVEYFGHGDVRMSVWQGDLSYDPKNSDEVSTNFGMAHGSDPLLIASFIGFLRRIGRTQDEIKSVLTDAGQEILSDDPASIRYSPTHLAGLENITNGEPATRFDIPERNLNCLLTPHPTVPGTLDRVGGTGIFTRNSKTPLRMVFVKYEPVFEHGESRTEPTDEAEFCESDIPTMAHLVCDLAMGEYRRDIHSLLRDTFYADN